MYGKKETHQYNKAKILDIVENIYENVNPYFGWMDSETNSYDRSFESLLNGKLPVGNEFVIVGGKMTEKFDKEELKRSKHSWKNLSDGSILIQRFAGGEKSYLD